MIGHDYRGFFLVVDGIDGSGKTTLCKCIQDILESKGIPTFLTVEPSGSEVGQLIRRYLRKELPAPSENTLGCLFVADRMLHIEREILPALNDGKVVICDRYAPSGFAYNGSGTLEDLDWTTALHERVIPADLTIILNPPLEVVLQRMVSRGKDPEHYETREKLQKSKSLYEWAARNLPAQVSRSTLLLGLNLSPTPEETAQMVADQVLDLWRR